MTAQHTIYEMASYLFDGGWRAVDYSDLKREYRLSADDALAICSMLEIFENNL